MFDWLIFETLEQKKCRLASWKKELEVLWEFENRGGYVFGNAPQIISLEKKVAYLEEEIKLMENIND
jgi:hypothetical protein